MNNHMSVQEFSDLQSWMNEVQLRHLNVVERSGSGEDPYTHYYATLPGTYRLGVGSTRVGYFGDANGADNDFGVLCNRAATYEYWMEG